MKEAVYVFLGGGFGSVVRLLINRMLNPLHILPLGTLACNSIASLLAGIFSVLIARKYQGAETITYLAVIGFCGGLSTFSTFSVESMKLFQNEIPVLALVNIGISIIVCLGCVWAGQKIALSF